MFGAVTAMLLFLVGAYLFLAPDLPAIGSLKEVRWQVPLRVYSRDGKLLAEYGEKRREPVTYEQVPERMVRAFLAAEDDRFFSHPGVDYQGLLRAALHLIRTGQKGQGGSTITMQVARNFFLSREKTYLRKLNEIFLALKIERELGKKDILALYLNIIFLGHRAYGVQAAAKVYYGVGIDKLTLAQTAMIAGLPKAPSSYNPIVNPKRALQRRNYVLGRMLKLNYITRAEYDQALREPVTSRLHRQTVQLRAPYISEMVRAEMVRRFGNNTYTAGYKVHTTISSKRQRAANKALRKALLEYDWRHGWRGAEGKVDASVLNDHAALDRLLAERPEVGGLLPGVVVRVGEKDIGVYLGRQREVTLGWEGLSWARKYLDDNHRGPEPKKAADIVSPGALVRVKSMPDGKWRLAQVPAVSGSLVALDPKDGSIVALVGGFDYFLSKFNRVIQAERQPGSSFKPFIYSAALEKGYTPATLINDAPVVFKDPALESTWRPENYTGKFYGPTRLRVALINSRNLVSIRLLRAIGIGHAIRYAARFGLPAKRLPRDLSLALGSGSVTSLQLARAYAVFANGGYLVSPYFIDRIIDAGDKVVWQAQPEIACSEACRKRLTSKTTDAGKQKDGGNKPARPAPKFARRVITPQNAWLMTSMMRDVIRYGTGRGAMRLGRMDLAGKTGTTNDQRDAWFSGFNGDLVATAWVGFDKVRPLGDRETGGRAALPMWVYFMGSALRGMKEKPLEQPPGLVTVRIDARTGLLAGETSRQVVFETFRVGNVPNKAAPGKTPDPHGNGPKGGTAPAPLF